MAHKRVFDTDRVIPTYYKLALVLYKVTFGGREIVQDGVEKGKKL